MAKKSEKNTTAGSVAGDRQAIDDAAIRAGIQTVKKAGETKIAAPNSDTDRENEAFRNWKAARAALRRPADVE